MGDKPLLWQVFDKAERTVAPRLEAALRTSAFAQTLGLTTRVQATAGRALERRSRRLWHLANLPAGSDVARLRRQVALLDREVRELSRALTRALDERETEEAGDADDPGNQRPARPRRAAGSRPPRR